MNTTSDDCGVRPAGLQAIFSPRSVAVIGAGRDPTSMSGRLFRNVLESFSGPVYPVNPHATEICGVRTVASVLQIRGPLDLALVAVPSTVTLSAVQECLEKQVGGLVVITAGFSETGSAGKDLERELYRLVRAAGSRMIGPNCIGVFNTDPAAPLNGTFAACAPPRGNIGAGTQSGALGVVIPEYLRARGVGASTFASIGNKADVSENDLLAYWRGDPATSVIMLYLESFADPRTFRRLAAAVSPEKPIVVLKGARTSIGARAASSHTAALATPDRAADALLHQSGTVRVATLHELFDVAALLACQPLPRGRSVAILTNAGGPAILCADALAAEGLMLPQFTGELQAQLRGFLRPETSVANPIDLIGSIDAGEFRRCLELLLDSPEIDAVITIYVPREPGSSPAIARVVREVAAVRPNQKIKLAVFMQTAALPAELADEHTHVPGYFHPEEAARALAQVVRYAEWRKRPHGQATEFADIRVVACREIIDKALSWSGPAGGWLSVEDIQHLLEVAGIPAPRWKVVHSADDAVAVAAEWNAPVVVKVISPTALHKTESGGVAVNLSGAAAVREAYHQMTLAVPDAEGGLVQEFVPGGHEALIGVSRDPQFGHLLAFGTGGIAAEVEDDVAWRLHPLTDLDADDMIQSVRLWQLLRGYRSQPAADVLALKQALLRISALLNIAPEIAELDLNPVKVLSAGNGISAVDARIRVATK